MNTFSLLLLIGCLTFISGQTVDIKWDDVIIVSKTVPTLQVGGGPPYRRGSKIQKSIFKSLASLKAMDLRIQFWYPFPRLSVAELEPPTNETTSWNFTLIDPLVEDFIHAQDGRPVIMDFSTIPQWMFKTDKKVPYPDDPDQEALNYNQGKELVDPSMKQIVDYFVRLFNWYVKGGFVDENGMEHKSGHYYTFDYWEVLNEPQSEHQMTPKLYTDIYDAIVSAIKKVSPNTKFVGLSLVTPKNELNTFFPYFLNHSNHKPDIPLDAISYHFYAIAGVNDTIDVMQKQLFIQSNEFIDTVNKVEVIRKSLTPHTTTMLNEVGTICQDEVSFPSDKAYWNLSAALFAYIYSVLSMIGIEVVGQSALLGIPGGYPSGSMTNWSTGELNAKGMVLKLLIESSGPGDQLVNTTISGTDHIHAMAFIRRSGEKRLLLINKRVEKVSLNLPKGAKKTRFLDIKTEDRIMESDIIDDKIELDGFAVHVIEL